MAAPITKDYRYVAVDRLLPAELIGSLSPTAVTLFEKLWNLAAKKGKDEIWVSDNAAAQMSCIAIDAIAPARAELIEAGLVTIKYGVWPQNDPANRCHRYSFTVGAEIVQQEGTGKNFRIPSCLVELGLLSSLSDEALRLYLLICYRIRQMKLATLWINDNEASYELGLTAKKIESARTELSDVNLIHFATEPGSTRYTATDKIL